MTCSSHPRITKRDRRRIERCPRARGWCHQPPHASTPLYPSTSGSHRRQGLSSSTAHATSRDCSTNSKHPYGERPRVAERASRSSSSWGSTPCDGFQYVGGFSPATARPRTCGDRDSPCQPPTTWRRAIEPPLLGEGNETSRAAVCFSLLSVTFTAPDHGRARAALIVALMNPWTSRSTPPDDGTLVPFRRSLIRSDGRLC